MQTLYIENREKITLNGIKDAGNFNEDEISLYTDDGKIEIKGSDLYVLKFDCNTGEFEGTGKINNIIFSEKLSKKSSLIERLLK